MDETIKREYEQLKIINSALLERARGIHLIYNKFKHLDPLLGDKQWLAGDHPSPSRQALYDFWLAIKAFAADPNSGSCQWKEDSDGIYHTSCAHWFEFSHGRPWDNGAVFCIYCGLHLHEVPFKEEGAT